jgi:hypothetical protein
MEFPAILTKGETGDINKRRQASIKDFDYEKHAQPILVFIEASECPYPDMKNGADEKCNNKGLDFSLQEVEYV